MCGAVLDWIAEEGLNLDVCTGGELGLALRAGFDPARIALHGNNKSEAELARALDARGRPDHPRLARRDRPAGRGWPSSVTSRRWSWCGSPSASRRTPTSTSRPRTRTRSSASRSPAARRSRRCAGCSPTRGCGWPACTRTSARRSGTPPGSRSPPGGCWRCTRGFATSSASSCPSSTSAAVSASRTPPRTTPTRPSVLASGLRSIVEHECRALALAVPRLSIEPGRAIAGPATCTLYRVGTVKSVPLGHDAVRMYVSVDGGMSDNIRPGAVRRRLLLHARLAGVAQRAGARAGGRQALRVRRHRGQGRVPAR